MTAAPGAGDDDLARLLQDMDPLLDPETFVVVTAPPGTDLSTLRPFAVIAETEGPTAIVTSGRLAEALTLGCTPADPPPMARITLQVHSSLLAVGLTAAVAAALAAVDISCNVIAGYFHDHLLVPVERAADALDVLRSLQAGPDGPG